MLGSIDYWLLSHRESGVTNRNSNMFFLANNNLYEILMKFSFSENSSETRLQPHNNLAAVMMWCVSQVNARDHWPTEKMDCKFICCIENHIWYIWPGTDAIRHSYHWSICLHTMANGWSGVLGHYAHLSDILQRLWCAACTVHIWRQQQWRWRWHAIAYVHAVKFSLWRKWRRNQNTFSIVFIYKTNLFKWPQMYGWFHFPPLLSLIYGMHTHAQALTSMLCGRRTSGRCQKRKTKKTNYTLAAF